MELREEDGVKEAGKKGEGCVLTEDDGAGFLGHVERGDEGMREEEGIRKERKEEEREEMSCFNPFLLCNRSLNRQRHPTRINYRPHLLCAAVALETLPALRFFFSRQLHSPTLLPSYIMLPIYLISTAFVRNPAQPTRSQQQLFIHHTHGYLQRLFSLLT